MAVYAYDPHTGTAIDLAHAVVVAEPAPEPIDEAAFADLDPDGYGELSDAGAELFLEYLRRRIPTRTHVGDVDPGDHLTDDQISLMLAGDRNAVYWKLAEMLAAMADYSTKGYIARALQDTSMEPEDLSDEHRQALRELIEDRDISDPVGDLLSRTPATFLRYPVMTVSPQMDQTEQNRRQLLATALGRLGLDPANHQEQIDELIEETRNHWHELYCIDLIVHARPAEAVPDAHRRTVKVTDPVLVVLDPVNGTGHDVKLEATVELPIASLEEVTTGSTERFILDADGSLRCSGYGWAETAGLSPQYYSRRIEQEPERVDPVGHAALQALTAARSRGRRRLIVEDPVAALFPDGVPC